MIGSGVACMKELADTEDLTGTEDMSQDREVFHRNWVEGCAHVKMRLNSVMLKGTLDTHM